MNIRTGDRVQFRPVTSVEMKPNASATGLVTKLHDFGGVSYALVKRDDGLLPVLLDTRELTLFYEPCSTKAQKETTP